MSIGFSLLRPFIHSLPPETAHHLGLSLLERGMWPQPAVHPSPLLETRAFGLTFGCPLGLAAGFDKNGVAINTLLSLGFGFVEAGTVTPMPQPGNPKPRIFRLKEDEALINRLGFNNEGLDTLVSRLKQRKNAGGILGINIGKNKTSTDAITDYITGLQTVYPYADYITVNISSPNTQGLRDLQQRDALIQLLSALRQTRHDCLQIQKRHVPILLKIAPDLDQQGIEDVVMTVLEHEIDGLIVSNTTIARPDSLRSADRNEQGGLSGKPLMVPSTECLKECYRLTKGRLPIVGVGGIASAEDAYAKIRAGATLVQLYTAIVYQGFGVVMDIRKGLETLLKRDGFTSVAQAVGVDS